jgi:hypothetical protein
MCIHTLRINCHKSQLCSQTYVAPYVSHTHVCKADEHSLNIQTHVVRSNNREAIHATSNRNNSAPDAAPNHSYALDQANLGKADNSAPDAEPDHSYALDQANLGKADNSAPDAAPDHSSANKADDRALYTNMWSSSNGRNMELCLP